jgi:WD40 repeat protein
VTTPSARVLRKLAPDQHMTGVALSPDGRRLATLGYREEPPGDDGVWVETVMRLFDAETAAQQWKSSIADHHDLGSIAFSPDGRLMVAVGSHLVFVIDARTGAQLWTKDLGFSVAGATFSQDSRSIATGSDAASLMFDAESGAERWQFSHDQFFPLHAQPVFSPDGRSVALGCGTNVGESNFGRVCVVDAATGQQRWTRDRSFWVNTVAYSPDGRAVVIGCGDGSAVELSSTTGEVTQTLIDATNDFTQVWFVVFSPDGRLLATSTLDTLSVFGTGSHDLRYSLAIDSRSRLLAFSPDSRSLLTGKQFFSGDVLDSVTGTAALVLHQDDRALDGMFSRDSRRVATVNSQAATIFELVPEVVQLFRLVHEGPVRAVVFGAGGASVATASVDKKARVFDAATGIERSHRAHDAAVNTVAFTPDGQAVLTGSDDNTAVLFTTATADQRMSLTHGGPVHTVAIRSDGRWAATGSADGTARIINLDTNAQHRKLTHDGPVLSVAFDPAADRIATGSDDNTARIYSIATGALLLTLAHTGAVRSVAFHPDGSLLATASDDHTARIYDTATSGLRATLPHSGPVRAVAFTPDHVHGCAAAHARTRQARAGTGLQPHRHPAGHCRRRRGPRPHHPNRRAAIQHPRRRPDQRSGLQPRCRPAGYRMQRRHRPHLPAASAMIGGARARRLRGSS